MMILKRGSVKRFLKMSGTGNDFVVVDNREGIIRDRADFTIKVCHRRTGVGADGVLLLENSDSADVRMRYLNSDGSEVDMCGNGARCIAHFASSLGYGKELTIQTGAGVLPATIKGDFVRIGMPESEVSTKVKELVYEGMKMPLYHANTGVTHKVMFVDNLEKIDVRAMGAFVRYHPDFNPPGTNMNFVRIESRERIHIRTYERGVEDETFACGTGATAAALIAGQLGFVDSPCVVVVRLPGELTIEWNEEDIFLSGEVKVTFKGEVEYP